MQSYLSRLDCPYLPGRESRLIFTEGVLAGPYRLALDYGYRRSGRMVYIPQCEGCCECEVLRLEVARFTPSKGQRRTLRRGAGELRCEISLPRESLQRRDLYQRYQVGHHQSTEPPLLASEYRHFFVDTLDDLVTLELQLYAGRRLIGLGLIDLFDDALSSVYFSFDPDYAAFSLGRYSMLYEIELAQRLGRRYYYPGYYIAGCQAMSYKIDYQPAEIATLGSGNFSLRGKKRAAVD